MRISDWSSDVCSSDLARSTLLGDRLGIALMRGQRAAHLDAAAGGDMLPGVTLIIDGRRAGAARARPGGAVILALERDARSEERRVGKECFRTWRSRWSPCH